MKIGQIVVQYDYVIAREERGTVIELPHVYNHALGDDVTHALIEWECGVQTQHVLDDFTAIAGRQELRCNQP